MAFLTTPYFLAKIQMIFCNGCCNGFLMATGNSHLKIGCGQSAHQNHWHHRRFPEQRQRPAGLTKSDLSSRSGLNSAGAGTRPGLQPNPFLEAVKYFVVVALITKRQSEEGHKRWVETETPI